MSTIRWLTSTDGPEAFPAAQEALRDPNGLLAAGGCLEPEWLLASYRRGIFPWYEDGQPILWWSPDPRAVLEPDRLVVSRSLRRTLKRKLFDVTADSAFEGVIDGCAEPRRYTDTTWITTDMAAAFCRLHALGWAHSFEAWQDGALAGGLYGVAIGRVFFGESMFSHVTDASKVAFVWAVSFLRARGFELIDCQLPSEHLTRFGAGDVARADFLARLARLTDCDTPNGSWTADFEAHTCALELPV